MFDIDTYITNLACKYSSIKSIWLIGSRANNTYSDKSDWDLLVFGDCNVLERLKKDTSFNLPDVDLLIVYDTENFISPWPRDTEKIAYKKGCLKKWQWKIVDGFTARYKSDIGLRNARKADKDAKVIEYTPQEKEFKAKRLWSKNERNLISVLELNSIESSRREVCKRIRKRHENFS